jgi:hypothetical protein
MVRGRRLAEVFTPDGLHDRWEALTLGARLFVDEVAQGQAEAETELRERFGLVPHGPPELGAAQVDAVGSVVSTGSTDEPTQEGDS